jgi:hypothetical protein
MTELSQVREPKFLPRKTRFVMGVDVGQIVDPTAICVIEYCEGVMDYGSDLERHTSQTEALGLQKGSQRWRCVHMERLPLGTKYGVIVQHVAGLLATPQLQADPNKNRKASELVIDAGGAGGVAEMFQAAGMDPISVIIRGGLDTNWKGRNRFTVAKEELIGLLDARLNHDRFPLTFSKHLVEGEAFRDEVADFTRSTSGAGRMKYEAKQGKHDDMILAVSLAVWWLSRPKNPPAAFGRYSLRSDGRTSTLVIDPIQTTEK